MVISAYFDPARDLMFSGNVLNLVPIGPNNVNHCFNIHVSYSACAFVTFTLILQCHPSTQSPNKKDVKFWNQRDNVSGNVLSVQA